LTQPERRVAIAVIAAAAAVRIALSWVNPPANSYDDHLEVVARIVNTWEIPDKRACLQCFHPPAFYVVAAVVARVAIALGASSQMVPKVLQFLVCGLSIGSLIFTYLIVGMAPVSGRSRLVAVAIVSFLPRHVYMATMFSNDAPSYFLITAAAYLAMRLVRGGGWPTAIGLACTATAAVFTKYTALAVLPTIAAAALVLFSRGQRVAASRCALALLVPVLILGVAMASNVARYGRALPITDAAEPAALRQPRDPGGADFTSFRPWQFVERPVLRPGAMSSFWTLLQAGAWFDIEPLFGDLLAPSDMWERYYAWRNGLGSYPGDPSARSYLAWGVALEVLGLLALGFALLGALALARRARARDRVVFDVLPVCVLGVFTLAGVARLTAALPAYSSMKASYTLGALAGFAVLIAAGVEWCAGTRVGRVVSAAAASGTVALVGAHIVHLVWAIPAI
jgi:hypothetical protein